MAARTTPMRLASVRAFARAVRSATRPGSAGLLTRVAALPRLARAVRNGEYLGASTGQLALLLASALYAVSPADLVPEAVLGVFGLGDDAIVLAYAASAFVNLTEDFLAWEQSRTAPSSASGPRPAADEPFQGSASAYRRTVQGSVIR